MSKATITLGVQSGDVASSEATRPVFMKLRQELARCCVGPYSREINEFAVVLRISGALDKFEGDGPQKLRLSRLGKYITIDIVVPDHRWRGASVEQMKQYFASSIKAAISAMISKLIKSNIEIDAHSLITDLEKAIGQFLKTKI